MAKDQRINYSEHLRAFLGNEPSLQMASTHPDQDQDRGGGGGGSIVTEEVFDQ